MILICFRIDSSSCNSLHIRLYAHPEANVSETSARDTVECELFRVNECRASVTQ